MRKLFIIMVAVLVMLLTSCATVPNNNTNTETSSDPANKVSGTVETFGLLDIELPDKTWRGKCFLETANLYKENHYKGDDPTIRIFIDDLGLEDSMASAMAFFRTLPDSDFELMVGPYSCVGHRAIYDGKSGETVIDRVFYEIDDERTLRFQVFVRNVDIIGLKKDDPEILSIMQSAIELNGFGKTEKIANTDGIIAEGKDGLTTWTLFDGGILHIGGATEMVVHYNAADYQWAKYREDVVEIQFDSEFTRIPSLAFKKFKKLKKVELPSSVKALDIGCFEDCSELEEAILPENLEDTDYYIFSGCSSLKEVTIPGTMKHIDNYSFDSCSSLETVWISPGVESLGFNTFSNCTKLKTLYLPKSVKKIGLYSFYHTYLLDIYYEGSEKDFNSIEIEENNLELYTALIHYNSTW